MMNGYNICLVLIFLCIRPATLLSQDVDGFLNTFQPYQGKTYEGRVVFPDGEANPFKGQALKVIFELCTDSLVRMPFHVGQNKSRTWILTREKGDLLFKHDHRHKDGTPDSITNYGGFARTGGDAFNQYFPADSFTAKLIPAAATNEWAFLFNVEEQILSYVLKRNNQLRFHAIFDLGKSVDD